MRHIGKTGPSSESYFDAVRTIAIAALQKFGLKNFRMWCEGSGGEYGGEKITKQVKDDVAYSSWIQSDVHVRSVIKFTRHKPFSAHLGNDMNTQRLAAIQAMQDDVKEEGNKLVFEFLTFQELILGEFQAGPALRYLYQSVTYNTPLYWKLRLVKAKRFIQYADFEEQDSNVDYKAKDGEIQEAKARLEAQYTAAKLPVPEIVLVPFNKDHKELEQ